MWGKRLREPRMGKEGCVFLETSEKQGSGKVNNKLRYSIYQVTHHLQIFLYVYNMTFDNCGI